MIRKLLFILLCICTNQVGTVFGQGILSPYVRLQFFTNAGAVCANCTLTPTLSGTSTPASVYMDAALATPYGASITLDATGRPAGGIFLNPATTYRFVLTDANSVTMWTQDGVNGGFAGTISGTQNVLAKFNSAGTNITNSAFTDTGTTASVSEPLTVTTSLTVPLVIGGSSASQTLILQTTSGVGTTDSFSVMGGNNGALTFLSINSAGVNTGIWKATAVGLAFGGTNANLTASNGGIFYSTASAGAILSATATANQMLQSGSNGPPAWSTATYPATTTANQILYSTATNTVGGSANLTFNATVLTLTGNQIITGVAAGTYGLVITGNATSGQSEGLKVNAGTTSADRNTTFSSQSAGGDYMVVWGDGGLTLPSNPTGGDKGNGTINVATGIYLNNSAYTNPDYAIEHWATGSVKKFAGNAGADHYQPFTLQQIRDFAKVHYYLPQLDFFNAHADEGIDIFQRADISLILHEDTFRFLFQLQDEIDQLRRDLQRRDSK